MHKQEEFSDYENQAQLIYYVIQLFPFVYGRAASRREVQLGHDAREAEQGVQIFISVTFLFRSCWQG